MTHQVQIEPQRMDEDRSAMSSEDAEEGESGHGEDMIKPTRMPNLQYNTLRRTTVDCEPQKKTLPPLFFSTDTYSTSLRK
jgi:hypothetical protein